MDFRTYSSAEIKAKIETLESQMAVDQLKDWWRLSPDHSKAPVKSSNQMVAWILQNPDEAKRIFSNSLIMAFELSVLRWIQEFSAPMPKAGIYQFLFGLSGDDFWGRLIREWDLVFFCTFILPSRDQEPYFIKLYPDSSTFRKAWLHTDGKSPKVFRLAELLSSQPMYWDSANTETDEEPNPNIHAPNAVLSTATLGPVSDLDDGALSFLSGAGMGFKDGKIAYISCGHDEWKRQHRTTET